MAKKNILTSLLSILSVSLYPCLYLFFLNIGTVKFEDIIGISTIIVFGSIVIFGLLFFLLRNIWKAVLCTNLIVIIFLYFGYIERALVKVFPMLYYWHVALICLFVVVHLIYLVHKKLSSKTADQFNQGFLFVFAGLILINGMLAIPKLSKTGLQNPQNNSQITTQEMSSAKNLQNQVNRPNVYYFIFDEYAGYDNILRYCDYDNSDFYSSLEQMGFVTSKHSINDTIDSFTEVPNLLQLRRVNTVDMTDLEKKENLKNPFLLNLMKESGYVINVLDSTNYEFIDPTVSDYQLTSEFRSTYGSFNSFIIQNTAYYPFYGGTDQENEIKMILSMFDYAKESSKKAENNLFTIGYFSFPHVPYIFDEFGNKTHDSDRLDLRNADAYLGQFKFANKKILEMVTEILENDPNSVIVLQSDHGYRLPSHLHFWYGIDSYDLTLESPFERNILNAVYFNGEKIAIDGLSGLDTLRIVLDKLLGVNIEELE